MDLTIPVLLKNNPMNFEQYCNTIEREESSSLEYLLNRDAVWNVPGSLTSKVTPDGILKPFYGDTTVIPLEENIISVMDSLQDILQIGVKELLAEPLLKGHFHITLHDLINSPDKNSIEEKMEENSWKCEEIFWEIAKYIKKNPDISKVNLRSLYAFPCVNVSAVIGFAPLEDQDYRTVMNLYNLFDDVVYLTYWLRMHVTLSYFKPFAFSYEQRKSLHKHLSKISSKKIPVTLDLKKLAYQRFDSMNHYQTLFTVEDFC